MIASNGFWVALPCAVLMGFAIQRGSTCIVAGVQEWVDRRDPRRLLALSEGAAWSGALLAMIWFAAGGSGHVDGFLHGTGISSAAVMAEMASSRATLITVWTVAGGMLLGLGAWVNGACVFGSVAAIGAGDWSYLAFPAGLAAGTAMMQAAAGAFGAAAFAPLLPVQVQPPIPFATLAPLWLAVAAILGSAILWRRFRRSRGSSGDEPGEWPPRSGVVLACLASAAMTLVFGRWLYSEVIAAWVRGDTMLTDARFLLFPALLLGSLMGGWTRGRFRPRQPTFPVVWRCLLGGALMAVGARLVPGANDGLLLMGLPRVAPEALVGLASMVLSLIALMVGARRLRRVSTDGAGQNG